MPLIICEKSKSAFRVASILSNGNFKTLSFGVVKIYQFTDKNKTNFVIGLKGHILSLDYPLKYSAWDRVELRELIYVQPRKEPSERGIVAALEKLAKESTTVIIATDYDREGELIGVESLGILKKFNTEITIKRARFSALTEKDVKNAFSNLCDVDYNLAKSAEARQIIDLAWGAVLTRFISLASGQIGKDFLSVGRVQSPTLRLIADREKEILHFISKPYWEINTVLEKNKVQFKALYYEYRIWDREKAERIYTSLEKAKTGKILSIKREKREEKPPAPFNTTAFLQSASAIGFSASTAMSIAENLYQSGLISYPRTDNTEYPKNLNLREILTAIASAFPEAKELAAKKVLIPTKGKKIATDHPPLHPVDSADKNKLSYDEWRIYELIARRFMATVADSAVSEITDAEIDISGEKFIAKGYRLLEYGWRKYYPYFKVKEFLIPELKAGDIVDIVKINKLDKETQPPSRYTQGSLIQQMERLNLGTKSTRHEIIKKLYERNYITGISPSPTTTGLVVADALKNYATQITLPDMTAALEKEMDEIADGKKETQTVITDSQKILEKVITILEKNKIEIGDTIKNALREQSQIGVCPQCGSQMLMIKSKKGKRFAGCARFPACQNSYPLPTWGKIILTNEKCEHCGAPKIKHIWKRKVSIMCINMACKGKNK